jgi:hypothetical protein
MAGRGPRPVTSDIFPAHRAPWAVLDNSPAAGRDPWAVPSGSRSMASWAVYVCCMSFFNVHVSTDLPTAAAAQDRKHKTAGRVACVVLSTARSANIEQQATGRKKRSGARGYRVKNRWRIASGRRSARRGRRGEGTGVKSMFLTNISQIETFLCDKSYKRDPGTPIFRVKKSLFE